MKKILSILLCFAILLSSFTFTISAVGENAAQEGKSVAAVWDGSIASGFASGNGTKELPYQITSGAHLAFLADMINYGVNGEFVDFSGVYFKVMNDIDMNGKPFEPIGGEIDTSYFSGYFDGNGKTISNLNLISTYGIYFTSVGLFGCIKNAVITNVTLKDLYMTNGMTAQTFFNYGSIAGKSINSQIINCHVDSDLTVGCHGGPSQATIYAGTIIGFMMDGGVVKGCTYDGTFTVNGRGDGENGQRVATVIGGIVGRLDWDAGTDDKQFFIEGCIVSGKLQNISSTYHIYAGGVVGIGFNGWNATDNVQKETPMVWLKDVFVDADIDLSKATMVNTAANNRYAKVGGITSQFGSYICEMENVHFGGNISGQNNSYFNASNSAFAGIIASSRTNNVFKNVTTSYDKVTINTVEYNVSGDPTSGIKNRENWKGNWDDQCKTGVADFASVKAGILAAIANGYTAGNISSKTIWSGSVATGFSSGAGSKNDPYRITSGAELAYIARQVNSGRTFEGIYFKLLNDIDMNGIPFEPIGGEDDSYYFAGYFDGDNRTITNLNLMSEISTHFMNAGLFGCVKNAVIANVTLEDICMTDGVTTQAYFIVGSLIGKAISSTVVNCHVKSDIGLAGSLPASQTTLYAGGLIGMIQDGGTVQGCTYDGSMNIYGRGNPDAIEESPEATLNLSGIDPVMPTTLGAEYKYTVGTNVLSKYLNESKTSFLGVCKYYEDCDYTLYGYNEMGNVYSATYVKNEDMAHIYWIGGGLNELCVVKSTDADLLPPKTPEVTDGIYNTVVTQMRALESDTSTNINGMGYVIRLADGSFIIYDGGYEIRLEELWDTLTTLNGGEEGIVIRAWLLTHAHGDHYPCFTAFANKYASKVTLERVLISPISASQNSNAFNNGTIENAVAKFNGAKLLYVHTGMVFTFCDVKMEILCTASEIYYDGVSNDFNNSSIVSRVYKEDGKSVMFLADAGDDVSTRLIPMYGDYLKSDICQASHHGVEDFTIEAYRLIRSADWFYPCSTALYNRTDRDAEVRQEIKNADYTKNIYRHDSVIRPVISLNEKNPEAATRVAVFGGGLVGRVDANAGTDDMVVIIEDCIVDGQISLTGPNFHSAVSGVLGIYYNGFGAADTFSSDFIRIYFKNILVSADIDISEVDYSRTPENNQYAKVGGITAWRGSGYCSFENCHVTGEFKGVGDDFIGAAWCKYGAMAADGAGSLSTFKNCTTTLDRMMMTAIQYEEDGTTVKFEENWLGQFDSDCKTGVAAPSDLRTNILANIEKGYEIDYGSEDDSDYGDAWNGNVALSFTSGSGTKNDPYIITSGGELAYLANRVNSGETFADVYFKLLNDIDMGGNSIEPIGCTQYGRYFSGSFDGNGKTIYNIRYNTTKPFATWGDVSVGLFGHVKNAVIRDLTIAGDDITARGGFFAGAIVGMAVNSEIIGCTNDANLIVSVLDGETNTSIYVGGIVGFAIDGTDIINCINNGTIIASGRHTENGHQRSAVIVGGIVGRCDNDYGTDDMTFLIKNCINSGDIFVTGKTWFVYVGGILGFFHNGWGGSDSYSDSWVGVNFENVLAEGDIDVTTVDIGADSGKTNNIEIGGIVCNTSKTCSFINAAHNGTIAAISEGSDPQLGAVKIAGINPNSRTKNNHESVTTSFDKFTFNAAEYNDDGSLKNAENKKGIYDENCKTGVTDTSAIKTMILNNIIGIKGTPIEGTSLLWSFDGTTGTLTISGTGEMPDYSYFNPPWYTYRDSIKNVVLEDGVTSIGDYAFYNCEKLESVTISDSVTSIGAFAFAFSTKITNIIIGNGITSIEEYAFYGCISLTSIDVSENNSVYKDIDGNLYSKDGKTLVQYATGKTATSFVIPEGVTNIEVYAFNYGTRLISVTIPDSVINIGTCPFFECINIASIEVSENNSAYKDIDGNLYSKDGKTLIQYAIGKTATSFVIPAGVIIIGEYAFSGCDSLTSVSIPYGVTNIEYSAFDFCDNLESITIPDSVTSIDAYAFAWCSSLTNVTIPEGVTTIEDSCFYGCESLTSVTIPDSVTSIETFAFSCCAKLENIIFHGTEEQWNNIEKATDWDEDSGEYTIQYHDYDEGVVTTEPTHTTEGIKTFTCTCGDTYTEPIDKLADHEWDEGVITWEKVGNNIRFIKVYTCTICEATQSEAVTGLKNGTCGQNLIWYFDESTGVLTISGTGGMSNYSNYNIPWFAYCSSINAVVIDAGVTSIGNYAFRNCTKLSQIIFHGTAEQWSNLKKGTNWNSNTGSYTVQYHDYNDGIITTKPTHTIEGVKTYTCTCGDTYTEPVAKLTAHEWNDGVVTTEPTHTTAGVKTFTCTCGDTYTEPVAKLTAHEWNDGVVTTEPTHTTDGVKTFTCTCGDTYTEPVAKLTAHEWNDGVVTTRPTYTADGEMTFTCTCGETYTESIPALIPDENSFTITASDKIASVGNKVQIPLVLSNNTGFAYLRIELDYDETVFTLGSVTNCAEMLTMAHKNKNISWDSSSNYSGNGELAILTFIVNEDATEGNYTIKITVSECYDEETEDVAVYAVNGTIRVVDFIYGDANGDGEVNGKDVIALRRHLVEPTTEIFNGADANGDGVINGKDVIVLRRYLVGDAVLGPVA